MNEVEWREHVERLAVVEERIAALDERARSNAERIEKIETSSERLANDMSAQRTLLSANTLAVENNTEITLRAERGFDRFKARVEPLIQINEGMQKGAAMLGKTADFAERWGKRIWHIVAFFGAVWAAFWIFFSGGGLAEAVRAFLTHPK